MAYTAAKAVCSPAELNRFAAAFLNTKDIHQAVDWDAAAQQFDPAVKTASFKTVTLRAVKKAVAAGEKGGTGQQEGGEGGGKPKGKGGRKRKAGDDGEGKSGKGKGGKKAKTAPVEQDGEREDGEEDADKADEGQIKGEGEDEDDEF